MQTMKISKSLSKAPPNNRQRGRTNLLVTIRINNLKFSIVRQYFLSMKFHELFCRFVGIEFLPSSHQKLRPETNFIYFYKSQRKEKENHYDLFSLWFCHYAELRDLHSIAVFLKFLTPKKTENEN